MAPSHRRDASTKHGQKRKRPSARTKPPVKQESQTEVIAKKLHHGMHEVRKAAKKAEAFELRKVVKRLKAVRTNGAQGNPKGDDPREMERQWEVLKHADHEQFGNTALRTKILKDGLLSKSEDVKAALEDKLSGNLVAEQEPGSSAAKVHARLLSSKILADAVHAVVDSLREVLNPSLAKRKTKAGDDDDDESDGESEEEEVDGDDDGEDVAVHSRAGKKIKLVHSGDESGSEAETDDAGWESGTVEGGEVGEGTGWESGSIDEEGEIAVANPSDETDESSDDDSEDDDSDDDDPDDDNDDDKSGVKSDRPPAQKAKLSGKEARAKSTAGGISTFLPSLSVGYTRGDSDASDISDGEAADAPRKNRRGQRARRAIWEKKYGRNANHVKNQQQQNPRQQHQKGDQRPHRAREERGARGNPDPSAPRPGRGALTGPARGPFSAGGAPSRRLGGVTGVARTGGGHGGNSAQGEKPLHPSWEAKKKLKEKQNPGIVAAQGKKITFS